MRGAEPGCVWGRRAAVCVAGYVRRSAGLGGGVSMHPGGAGGGRGIGREREGLRGTEGLLASVWMPCWWGFGGLDKFSVSVRPGWWIG